MKSYFNFENERIPACTRKNAKEHFNNGGDVLVTTNRGYFILRSCCKTGFDKQLTNLHYFHSGRFGYYAIPNN